MMGDVLPKMGRLEIIIKYSIRAGHSWLKLQVKVCVCVLKEGERERERTERGREREFIFET